MKIQNNKVSKLIKGIIVTFLTLLVMYLGVSLYFMNHFHFGSVVNNVNVAGKTVKEADKQISNNIEQYEIQIIERDNISEVIRGKDIGLSYNKKNKIQEIKDSQNPFGWISGLFGDNKTELSGIISYDKEKFSNVVDNLKALNNENIIEPKNPTFQYDNSEFKIVDEIKGNRVDKDKLIQKISEAVLRGELKIDLDAEGCYVEPKYNKDSDEVKQAKDKLDSYLSTKITYTFGDAEEILDGSIIKDWVEVDENMNVIFNEENVKSYVYSLAKKYNTYGSTRDFNTSYGTTVQISGGEYGWIINKSEETNELINLIKEGKSTLREPVYSQVAYAHGNKDYGNTYVEISLSNQHLWLYKDGNLITEGDIVTGNVSNGCATPPGVYMVYYKQKDATLKGEGYETKVSYWMPFNGGIGLHDANWRDTFGGNIYLTGGSHGCVNCPYSLASTLYQYLEAGTPVICY